MPGEQGLHYLDFDNRVCAAPLGVTANTLDGRKLAGTERRDQEIGFKYQEFPGVLPTSASYHRSFTGLQYQPTNGLGVNARRQARLWVGFQGCQLQYRGQRRSSRREGGPDRQLSSMVSTRVFFACFPYTNTVTGVKGCRRSMAGSCNGNRKFRVPSSRAYNGSVRLGRCVTAFVTVQVMWRAHSDQSAAAAGYLRQHWISVSWNLGWRELGVAVQGTNVPTSWG